jgi:hypothetical protein
LKTTRPASEPYFSRLPVLRFVLVLLFYAMLLSLAARLIFPVFDTLPGEEPVRVELRFCSPRLSDIVGISVWLCAILLACFDARQIRRIMQPPTRTS